MRIITTEPGSTEIIAYLDGGVQRIFGVSDKCDYPPEVVSKPKVVRSLVKLDQDAPSEEIDRVFRESLRRGTPLYELDWELVEEIDPDLIVGQTLCSVCALPLSSQIQGRLVVYRPPQRLRSLKVRRIVNYSPRTFRGVAQEALKISKHMGSRPAGRAAELLEKMERLVGELRGLGRGSRTVFIEWLSPIYIAGLWVSDLIEISGSEHPVGSGAEGVRTSWDLVLRHDPDYVLISPCGFTIERTLREINIIEDMPGWRGLKAVRAGRVYVIDSAYCSRPGPRVVELAKVLINIYTGSDPERGVAVPLY